MQMLYRNCVIFSFLIFSICLEANAQCGDWQQYKDEKCYKIIDGTFRTYDEAVKACAKLDNNSTLPMVRSKEEQDFITNFLYKLSKKVDNFWLGAKFSTSFKWVDNSALTFTNWGIQAGRNKFNYCLEIQSYEAVAGKWIDVPCEKKNLVVCQKMPVWTIDRLEKAFLEARKEQKQSLDEANRKISDLKRAIETSNNIANNLKLTLIPIGFLYAQYPNEKAPSEIWPWMTWKDESAAFPGVFFRVSGGSAAAFGQVQDENAPHLTDVSHARNAGEYVPIKTVIGGLSKHVLTGVFNGHDDNSGINFRMSGGEIRPRNMAMRIWKRTA